MSHVMEISSYYKLENLLKEKDFVIIDFWANWCSPCKQISPIIDKLSNDYKNISFVSIDIDENNDITENFKITSLPTFCFIKNGKEINRHIGVTSYNSFYKKIEEIFSL